MGGVLLDAFLDALKLLPFLLLLYILIELMEHRTAVGRPARLLTGKAAPFLGAATGLIPMCGFSVMASKLYERKYLTLGTLLAVFVATSDEALLVLLLSELAIPEKLYTVLALLGTKLVLGAGTGYLADLIIRPKTSVPSLSGQGVHENGHAHGEHGAEEDGREPAVCEHKHESKWTLYLFSPLLHALEVAAVIFLFNFIFGALFYGVGEDKVVGFLRGAGYWYQPLVAAVIGIIPNCASSVVLAETYALGGLTFSALLGGLVANAGLGVFVLFKNASAWRRNLAILGATLLLGIAFGYCASAIEIFI